MFTTQLTAVHPVGRVPDGNTVLRTNVVAKVKIPIQPATAGLNTPERAPSMAIAPTSKLTKSYFPFIIFIFFFIY